MTSIEYAYTERDIYTAIVQTAVPIALTAEETVLLVADLLSLAAEMPHADPTAVYHALVQSVMNDRGDVHWRSHLAVLKARAARSAVLARHAAEYPSLKGGV